MDNHYDIVIVGGGLVGLSLAHALADLPLRLALLESPPPESKTTSTFDARSLALSLSSQHILEHLGLWSELSNVTPIKQIHISERGRFGSTHLRAQEQGVDAFGCVVEIETLAKSLEKNLARHPQITRIMAQVVSAENQTNSMALTLSTGETIHADLVLAADGAQSSFRTLFNIGVTKKDYQQMAVIANIGLRHSHGHQAFERFTPRGPLALLPLSDDRMALVWTFPKHEADFFLKCSEQEFLDELQSQFGTRLGRFKKLGVRQSFPLFLIKAQEQIRPRLVILGNAAHVLHPIAGQGFNLSLRDVATIAEVLRDALNCGERIDSLSVLQRYLNLRKQDQRRILGFTRGLLGLFSMDVLPCSLMRSAGLGSLDALPAFKRAFAQMAMGLSGRVPDLACYYE